MCLASCIVGLYLQATSCICSHVHCIPISFCLHNITSCIIPLLIALVNHKSHNASPIASLHIAYFVSFMFHVYSMHSLVALVVSIISCAYSCSIVYCCIDHFAIDTLASRAHSPIC